MRCPRCGATGPDDQQRCGRCGYHYARRERTAPPPPAEKRPPTRAMRVATALMWTVFAAISLAFLCMGIYRAYFWYDAWRTDRVYETGEKMAPEVEDIVLDDGQVGHAITFYGEDGDNVFIKELSKSYRISGGLTRIELADSSWFDVSPDDVEAAIVTLTPILECENGDRQPLPPLEMTIEVPESPLSVISPPEDFQQVYTSVYPLEIEVVPHSTVLVNGEDATDFVSFEGVLYRNVSVYPVGDNKITLLVSTPHHKQTRREIVLYREQQEILLEPSLSLPTKSNSEYVTISGKMDPQALLSVDTPYKEDSIEVKATGDFSFKAKMTEIGDNTVTFRASMPGKTDSSLSVTVYYVPNENVYTRSAWAMDRAEILLMYEQRLGQNYLCQGPVVDVVPAENGGVERYLMDVGKNGKQELVLLENRTAKVMDVGKAYRAYADVVDRVYYGTEYVPVLAVRYLYAE